MRHAMTLNADHVPIAMINRWGTYASWDSLVVWHRHLGVWGCRWSCFDWKWVTIASYAEEGTARGSASDIATWRDTEKGTGGI